MPEFKQQIPKKTQRKTSASKKKPKKAPKRKFTPSPGFKPKAAFRTKPRSPAKKPPRGDQVLNIGLKAILDIKKTMKNMPSQIDRYALTSEIPVIISAFLGIANQCTKAEELLQALKQVPVAARDSVINSLMESALASGELIERYRGKSNGEE